VLRRFTEGYRPEVETILDIGLLFKKFPMARRPRKATAAMNINYRFVERLLVTIAPINIGAANIFVLCGECNFRYTIVKDYLFPHSFLGLIAGQLKVAQITLNKAL
jgi:hypothetical protein